MSNHDTASKKAFDYPLESSSVSSVPPSHHLNTEINVANKNHTNIIDLCEGKTNIVKQTGGGHSHYNYIVNPETGRKIKISGRKGKQIISNYLKMINRVFSIVS